MVHFCNGFLSQELANSTHRAQGHCHGVESVVQAEFGSLPPNRFSNSNNAVDSLSSLYNEIVVNYRTVIEETHKHVLELRAINMCFMRPKRILYFSIACSGVLFPDLFENMVFNRGLSPYQTFPHCAKT
jgi:hypothetical protein